MRRQLFLGLFLICAMPSCSLIRSPQKTVDRVQERFLDAARDTVAAKKLGGGELRHLEAVRLDPGQLGVGDLVTVRRFGEDNVSLQPLFSMSQTVFADSGMSGSDKEIMMTGLHRALCHQTPFSTTVEVSRSELKKARKVGESDQLKKIFEANDGLRGGMQFAIAGRMNELKASFLEDFYARVEEGRVGGRYTPGLNHFSGKLKTQLETARQSISAGGEVYAIGRAVVVDMISGKVVPKDGDEPVPPSSREQALSRYGQLLIPHTSHLNPSFNAGSTVVEFVRHQRFCWAVTGYRVSIASDGKLLVDVDRPMKMAKEDGRRKAGSESTKSFLDFLQ